MPNLANLEENHDILRKQLDAGRGTDLDVTRANALGLQVAARVPQTKAEVVRHEQRLAVLTAQPVAAHRQQLAATRELPPLPAATALITYTSGSTGAPKGVCLSEAHLDRVSAAIVDALAGASPRRHLSLLPLSVLLEQVAGVGAALLADAEVVLPSLAETGLIGAAQLDPMRMAACIDRHRPESLILVPQMLQAWLGALAQGATAPDSLRFCAVGGAKVGTQLLAGAQNRGMRYPDVQVIVRLPMTGPPAPGLGIRPVTSASALTMFLSREGSGPLGVDHYELQRSTDGFNWTTISAAASFDFVDSGLTAATTYHYRARAADSSGRLSDWSDSSSPATAIAGDLTPPSVPIGLAVTQAAGDALLVSWTPSTDDAAVQDYDVLRGAGDGAGNPAGNGAIVATQASSPWLDATGLSPGQEVYYRIRARDTSGHPAAFVIV